MIDPLKVFITVVELESFSKAAEQLYLTQPSVSQHIRNLEKDMGVQLLNRTSKYVKITEAGQIVYNKAINILDLYEKTKEELRILTNEVSGMLRIGSGLSIGESVLPNILSAYTKNYPLVESKITIENNDSIVKKVRSNDLDIGLISDEVLSTDLKSEKLTSDEMVIIIPINHYLSRFDKLDEEQLNNQIWIVREKGSGTRSFYDQLITELNVTTKRTFVFNSSQALKESVSSGLGISLVSKSIVKKDVAAGYLQMKRLKNRTMNRGFYIIYRTNYKKTKAFSSFMDELMQYKRKTETSSSISPIH